MYVRLNHKQEDCIELIVVVAKSLRTYLWLLRYTDFETFFMWAIIQDDSYIYFQFCTYPMLSNFILLLMKSISKHKNVNIFRCGLANHMKTNPRQLGIILITGQFLIVLKCLKDKFWAKKKIKKKLSSIFLYKANTSIELLALTRCGNMTNFSM